MNLPPHPLSSSSPLQLSLPHPRSLSKVESHLDAPFAFLPSFPRFSAASIWPNFNPRLSDEKEQILRLFRNEEEVSSEAHATPVLLPTIASNLSRNSPPPFSRSTYFIYYCDSN